MPHNIFSIIREITINHQNARDILINNQVD